MRRQRRASDLGRLKLGFSNRASISVPSDTQPEAWDAIRSGRICGCYPRRVVVLGLELRAPQTLEEPLQALTGS